MTFICGYVYQSTVSIIADSVETTIGPAMRVPDDIHPVSTFQERFVEDGEKVVMESAQKIYNLRNKLIIAFSGDVNNGLRVIEELNYLLLKEERVVMTVWDYFTALDTTDNDFLVVFMNQTTPSLYVYKGGLYQQLMQGELCYVHTGVELAGLIADTKFHLKAGASKALSVQDLLTYMLANMQLSVIHNGATHA